MLLWEVLHRQVPFRTHSPLQAAYAVAMERERPPVALKSVLAPFASVRHAPYTIYHIHIPRHPRAPRAARRAPRPAPRALRAARACADEPRSLSPQSPQVIVACWDESPVRRPGAAEVVEMLTTLEAAMPAPKLESASGSFLQSLIKKGDGGQG